MSCDHHLKDRMENVVLDQRTFDINFEGDKQTLPLGCRGESISC